MVVNPFHPPRTGLDDAHQGVDLAYQLNGESIALEGQPVQAVMDGKVASVLSDRFPYGNAILIETPLDELLNDLSAQLQIPTPAPTRESQPLLTCPTVTAMPTWEKEDRSLYLLYAHFQEPLPYVLGGEVLCGQYLGATGSTGNALNPHLHLETRIGPSGANFASLAHYNTSATPDEMANYCTWRVSGLFQLINPMDLFTLVPRGN